MRTDLCLVATESELGIVPVMGARDGGIVR